MTPSPDAQEYVNYLVSEGYFKPVNIAPDMKGYALTPKGRTEAWNAWDRHKEMRDVLSKL